MQTCCLQKEVMANKAATYWYKSTTVKQILLLKTKFRSEKPQQTTTQNMQLPKIDPT